MTEPEINAAFAEMDPQHPFYRAVLQLLNEGVAAEQDNVTVPNLTDAARHFNAGRLAHAVDMRSLIPDATDAALAGQRKAIQTQERAAARREAESSS
jgi:hypothetical protein